MAHPQNTNRGFWASGKGYFAEVSGSTNTTLQTKHGVVKFHSRPNTSGYGVEVKTEPSSVSGTHFGIECTVDHIPSTATSALGARGVGGICRLKSGYTMTTGGLIGSYGQIQNNGTLNGAGIHAAQYALIEAGGTWTAVSHVAVSWLDSHLTQTISSGTASFQYITNNGSTTFDNVWYIYPGNKITNLFTIDATDAGLVGDPVTSDYTFTKTRLIKVNVGGETGYLVVDVP